MTVYLGLNYAISVTRSVPPSSIYQGHAGPGPVDQWYACLSGFPLPTKQFVHLAPLRDLAAHVHTYLMLAGHVTQALGLPMAYFGLACMDLASQTSGLDHTRYRPHSPIEIR